MQQTVEQLAARFRAVRVRFGQSQRAFAETLGLANSTISRMESGAIVVTGLSVLALVYLEKMKTPDELKAIRLLNARAVKRERKAMGLSKYALSQYLKVSPSTVTYWESGKLDSASNIFVTLAIEQLKIELAQRKELSEMTTVSAAQTLFEDLLAA